MDSNVSSLVDKIIEWKAKYKYVYSVKIANEIFVFKALTRDKYNEIVDEKDSTDMSKEEDICIVATLYPEDFDFNHCLAGIPTKLSEAILTESLLMDDNKLVEKIYKHREEMKSYENQISCLIIEAFPSLTLDEVESWDMHKTAYYLSRAEWVLSKLRGLPFVSQSGNVSDEIPTREMPKRPMQTPRPAEKQDDFYRDINDLPDEALSEIKTRNEYTKKKDNKNASEIEELKRNFPEIDWDNDSLLNGDFDFEKDAEMTWNAEDAR